jgi:hypothetical protein
MNHQTEQPGTDKKGKRASLLSWFVSKEEPDKDYMPDLKSQWAKMTTPDRVKFILGGLIGLILFICALLLVYLILGALIG